jgi:predicted transcriptional regulator
MLGCPSCFSSLHSTKSNRHQKPGMSGRRGADPAIRSSRYVVCLDFGSRGQMLKRHIAGHGLSVEQYRARWNLPCEHPMTAPNYSERRSGLAKQLGLGRNRGASIETMAVPEMETQTAPKTRTPRRRPGRPRTPRS